MTGITDIQPGTPVMPVKPTAEGHRRHQRIPEKKPRDEQSKDKQRRPDEDDDGQIHIDEYA